MSLPLSAVGIVTCDRKESLLASLGSYLGNCRRYARTPEFVVVDDSDREDGGATIRTAIATLERSKEVLRSAGLTQKRRFALLLDILDLLVFSADDDTVCRTAAAPEAQTSVAVTSEYDLRRLKLP